jgi:glycosyltransferase involved in cell wall biosynthesis
MNHLSVVIIGKNEEAYITECLRSVQAAAAAAGGAEIVYVDSASTDRTVELALAQGVRVLQLPSDWPLSPAAGRYIGFHHTSGELVMFVDADTLLDRQWLDRALAYFAEAEVAGLAGYLRDLDEYGREMPSVGEHSSGIQTLPTLRGIAMYRRAALAQVGTFNPYLRSEEEAELALRLRKAGWKLLQLPWPMGSHRRSLPKLSAMWRALRLGRVSGIGLTWRYACRHGSGWQFCFEGLRHSLLFAGLCGLFSPGLVLAAMGHTWSALPFAGLWLAWVCAVAWKKGGLEGLLSYALTHLLVLAGLLSGLFVRQLAAPESYPRAAHEVENPFQSKTAPEANASAFAVAWHHPETIKM